jgi:hypothetical protein
LSKIKNTSLKLPVGVSPLQQKNWWNELIWVTAHCNRAAVSRNRYGVEKTVDTHKILINAITFYACLQEI